MYLNNLFNLKGKVAVVIGGGGYLCKTMSFGLSKAGCKLAILDLRYEKAKKVSKEIKSNGSEAIALSIDVSKKESHLEALDQIIKKYGKVDVLVNCAGTILRANAENTTDDDWHRVMSTNVNGLFFMSRAAIRPMIKNGNGVIINFGSIWGSVGSAGVVAYCASKGAVHQITRAMALDHAKDGIRINSVCPGEVNTPMLSTGRKSPPTKEDLQKLADETIPVARLAEPEEIANVVYFLASEDASYMTGSMITVDGGFTTR